MWCRVEVILEVVTDPEHDGRYRCALIGRIVDDCLRCFCNLLVVRLNKGRGG